MTKVPLCPLFPGGFFCLAFFSFFLFFLCLVTDENLKRLYFIGGADYNAVSLCHADQAPQQLLENA